MQGLEALRSLGLEVLRVWEARILPARITLENLNT
jgi:hypothetical protein